MTPMNIEQAHDYIQEHRPEVIHLSGKTSTGKSTFANQLGEEFGYKIIELDQVVRAAVIDRYNLEDEGQAFVEVYKNRDRADLIDSFIAATKEKVMAIEAGGHPVIIDGAIANPQTLKELFTELASSTIVYLHPSSLDNYRRNLTNRFKTATMHSKAGLPVKFWEMVDQAEFSKFCESGNVTPGLQRAIVQYAAESQSQSTERLQMLRASFNNILVVDI